VAGDGAAAGTIMSAAPPRSSRGTRTTRSGGSGHTGAAASSTSDTGVATTPATTEGRAKRSSALAAAAALKVIDRPKKSLTKDDEWLARLEVGSKVDARDTKSDGWYKSKVIDVAGNKVKIHYQGFSQRSDEWMERDLARLQPHGTEASATDLGAEQAEEEPFKRQTKRPRTAPSSLPSSSARPRLQPAAPLPAWGDGPLEIVGDTTSICIGNFRLKIGLLDPPRVVIRDMVSMVCELTDQESAALNIKSLARSVQCVRLTCRLFPSSYSRCGFRIRPRMPARGECTC
jgi:hypothetical protein